jgi:hypothetical protein
MKPSANYAAVLLVSAFLLLPSLVFAEVKIELKNGRTIIADFCEEAGASLACSKMGGTFDIEKKDIAKIGEISGGRGDHDVVPDGPDTPQGEEQEKTGEGKKNGRGDEQAPALEGSAGAAGRIEEIRKQKSEMAPEREKLLKEREKLQEDLKKAPDWMPVKQYEELQKRNAEINEKIKKYNEEVGRLNREEKSIVEESKNKKD